MSALFGHSANCLTWRKALLRSRHAVVFGADLIENGLESSDGFGEQFRAGDAAGWSASEKVWLQRGEAVVVHGHRVGHHVGDASVSLSGQSAVIFAAHPILDVKMDGPRLRHL